MAMKHLLTLVVTSGLLLGGCGDSPRRPGDGGVDSMIPPIDGGTDSSAPDSTVPPGDGGTPDGSASPWVDPTCIDGMYSETLPNPDAPIDDVPFSAADVPGYFDGILDRRYPVGAFLVRGGRMDTSFGGDCSEIFAGSPTTGADAINRASTVVHECGHFYDLFLGDFGNSEYVVTDSLSLRCDRGDTTSRGGDTFARSRMNGDDYAAMRTACGGGAGFGCDSYADIYLDGDPDDGEFDGGDQGFNSLLEETTQYVNSLVTSWVFADQMGPGRSTSARDGILTFLWYVERYLRMARLEYPDAYARLSNPCWSEAILTIWGRAWLYLELTDGMAGLGIDDGPLMDLVTDADLLMEIELLRGAAGCGP